MGYFRLNTNRKREVLSFNHISDNLSGAELWMLTSLYEKYHSKYWCYKQLYRRYKRRDLILTASTAVVTAGGLAGTAAFMPMVAVGVVGIILGVITKKKNYSRKIEMCRFAYTSYQKILNQLTASLRGAEYNKDILIHELEQLDNTVIDLCPPIDKIKTDYNKYFTTEFTKNIKLIREEVEEYEIKTKKETEI